MRSYMTDRQEFFRTYIRGEFDSVQPKSMALGTAYHKAVELYWTAVKNKRKEHDWMEYFGEANQDMVSAIEQGLVDLGAATQEELTSKLLDLVNAFREERPTLEPLAIEQRYKTAESERMPLPIKIRVDMYAKVKKEHIVIDWKTVSEFTPKGVRPASYDIIAGATFSVFESMGLPIDVVRFHEMRKSEVNPFKGMLKADIVVMCQEHGLIFDKRATMDDLKRLLVENDIVETPMRTQVYDIRKVNEDGELDQSVHIFQELYERITAELMGQPFYNAETGFIKMIPNPFDMLRGEESWQDFVDEVMKSYSWNINFIGSTKVNKYQDLLDSMGEDE